MSAAATGVKLPRIEPFGCDEAAAAYGMDAMDLESLCDRYGHDECYVLALAINERTGWPLKLLRDGDGTWLHAAAVAPSGALVDIYGVFPKAADVKARYDVTGARWRGVTPEHVAEVVDCTDDDMEDAKAILDEPWMGMVLAAAGHEPPPAPPGPAI